MKNVQLAGLSKQERKIIGRFSAITKRNLLTHQVTTCWVQAKVFLQGEVPGGY